MFKEHRYFIASDAAEGRHEYVICADERPMRPKADMNM
jgi:hypothetical protein